MFHVILLILKIIGITLLLIIGLILSILLMVLLVPIRYQISVTHGEEFYLEGRMSWLLHILGARVSHIKGILHIRIRLLWMVLYDNQNPKKPKVKKKIKRARIKKSKKVHSRVIKKDRETITVKNKTSNLEEKKQVTEISSKKAHNSDVHIKKKNETIVSKKGFETEIIETDQSNDREGSRNPKEHEKNNSLFKIIFNKIKNIKVRIVAFFIGLKRKIITGFESIANIKYKGNLILDFIKNEINKEGFRVTYSSIKKLLKHILPTKLRSKIIFGTGDPCSTGQALGFMGILYSLYGDKIVIIPDFENARFEGEHFARGRIRLITLLIIVIKLILDKRFKQLKNNFQILKEAL